MAELVNQRIEDMINELEQMRRMNLYTEEEIKELSRKRKEFEYHIQRRIKQKEDYVQYIAYEMALLEDITIRRKQSKLTEKKKEIEFSIAQRLNRLFKQFIYRFQDDIQVYFEYIRFCTAVGFKQAISGIIGQMLQIHGDKPKMWLMASKWESEEENNLENARGFLLKGIQRHPDSEVLYLELFNIELIELSLKTEGEEEKEKQTKRADVVWRNGMKNITDVTFLLKLLDLCMKYDVKGDIYNGIKQEVWSKRNNKEVWIYIATKELQNHHWDEINDYVDDEYGFPPALNNFIAVYEEALLKFPEEKLFTKFFHEILGLTDSICNDVEKIKAVKHAWMYGHENGLLSSDLYGFGIKVLKKENIISNKNLTEILETAVKRNPNHINVWEELILLNKNNETKMMWFLQDATKKLKVDDAVSLYNLVLDNVKSNTTLKNFYSKFQSCENAVWLSVKPKLLQKMYDHNGLKAAREIYDELIRTPPTQVDVHKVMIDIEKSQEKVSLKNIRKCYECLVQHHGSDNGDIWADYMKFEVDNGNAQASPAIYRRAVAALKKELVDDFIKDQALSKLK